MNNQKEASALEMGWSNEIELKYGLDVLTIIFILYNR